MAQVGISKFPPSTNSSTFSGHHMNTVLLFRDFYKGDTAPAKRIFELVKDCVTTDDVRAILLENGFEFLEQLNHARCSSFRYADNNNTIVETYYDPRFTPPLSVNVTRHSFDTVNALRGFHTSWDTITSMSPMEMQE